MEKKKAEAILNFASLFINEFLKMMKNSQILVNQKKHSNKKKGIVALKKPPRRQSAETDFQMKKKIYF